MTTEQLETRYENALKSIRKGLAGLGGAKFEMDLYLAGIELIKTQGNPFPRKKYRETSPYQKHKSRESTGRKEDKITHHHNHRDPKKRI